MAIDYLGIYNDITGQAWSMFDSEVEDSGEFETAVTTSIQKALGELWCSYKFPFREKEYSFETASGENGYETPNGKIIKNVIGGKEYYAIKLDGELLSYNPACALLSSQEGKPEQFYLKGERIYLYPTPDDVYTVNLDYLSILPVKDEDDNEKATFENDTDYIDIPEKYERYFKNCLMPLAMMYTIAALSDENYSAYKEQYEKAYKILIDMVSGIETDKRIGW